MTRVCDQTALHAASNLVFHGKTKQIAKDCHFIRFYVETSLLALLVQMVIY